MRTLITAQQITFFRQNGYIEFEMNIDLPSLFSEIESVLKARGNTGRTTPEELIRMGRDLWRDSPLLKTLLLRKFSSLAQSLVDKPLRVGLDQWIPEQYAWKNAAPFKDLFCIQGLALGAILSFKEIELPKPAALGLLPFPKVPGSVLFLKPELLLNLQEPLGADRYFAAYAFQNAVYISNLKDPSVHGLKDLGYAFGDVLQNYSHPILMKT